MILLIIRGAGSKTFLFLSQTWVLSVTTRLIMSNYPHEATILKAKFDNSKTEREGKTEPSTTDPSEELNFEIPNS